MKKTIIAAAFVLSVTTFFTGCSGNSNNTKPEATTPPAANVQTASDEMYTCTMHNEVLSDHEADCPKCGMKLVKQKLTAAQQKMLQEGTYIKPKE